MAGSYRGVLNVEGHPYEAEALLVQDGSHLTVRLHSPMGLTARGHGHLANQGLHLELRYAEECDGTLLLEGRIVDAEGAIRGSLRARDCTGEALGSFQLARAGSR